VSQREIASLTRILTDPENENRSAEELAVLILVKMYDLAVSTAKAEIRTETRREIFDKDSEARRLAVVGQIRYGPQEAVHTVVLGPFHASRPLRDEERLREALELPNAQAREAGQHLAWDSKTGKGEGRFMLAPAFMKPRDAWDFYRGVGPAPVIADVLAQIPPRITGPVCLCGLREGVHCHAHPEGR
jgi:hypothetical protein